MLLKWIECSVLAEQRKAFSTAQEAWAAMASEQGFLGQCGGWKSSSSACILGLWESQEAHDYFLHEGCHDSVFKGIDQAHTMKTWSTVLMRELSALSGVLPDLPTAVQGLGDETVLYLGNHSSQGPDGMLAGSHCVDSGGRESIVSLWQSIAQLEAGIDQAIGIVVPLTPAWTVRAIKR